MIERIFDRVFGNYKSTLIAIALAVGNVILNGRTPHVFGMSIGVAIFGAVCKD